MRGRIAISTSWTVPTQQQCVRCPPVQGLRFSGWRRRVRHRGPLRARRRPTGRRLTPDSRFVETIANDRIGHAWELGLCGLRRGEIAGLRWGDVDLERQTLSITNSTDTSRSGSDSVRRDMADLGPFSIALPPASTRLLVKAAKKRQVAERLALGGGSWEYVVCNEAGDPYHPQVLSRYWQDAVKAAGLRPIQLHAARHTAATAMHLAGGAGGGDPGVDRAQGCVADDAALCALPRRRIERGR
jgi:integrase